MEHTTNYTYCPIDLTNETIDLILLQSMEQGLEHGTITLQCLNQAHNDILLIP